MHTDGIARRTLLTATTAAVTAGLLSQTAADAGPTPAADGVLQTIALPTLGGRAAAASSAVLTERATRPFSLLGVTWTDPAAAVAGVVQVRTRDRESGRWSDWQTLASHGAAAGDARGGTDPLWVGESDGVQVRVTGVRLPAGLRVDLINPGEPATTADPGQDPAPNSALGKTGIPLPARPVPRMVTRAGWGANEVIVKGKPQYTGPIEVFFVHHTATGNSYSRSQSAAIVRGIQAYQVRSRGWDDIGYNFLVDKYGTIFEGRAGGVGRPVLGAHTLGFNTHASAIAVIGTFDSVPVAPIVQRAIATVAAYKLGAYGSDPAGRVVLTSGGGNLYPRGTKANLWRISGHRNAGRTDCPGDALYAQLPAIRVIAGAAPAGLRFQHIYGATKVGAQLHTEGAIKPLWTLGTPSALINRFEIWVDTKLALATPGSHRTALVHLPRGRHTLSIRAVALSGRTSTVTTRVICR